MKLLRSNRNFTSSSSALQVQAGVSLEIIIPLTHEHNLAEQPIVAPLVHGPQDDVVKGHVSCVCVCVYVRLYKTGPEELLQLVRGEKPSFSDTILSGVIEILWR